MSAALRLSKRELFALIGYEPHKSQVLVHRSTAPRRIVACGTRWGKSTAAAAEVVAALMEPRERSLGWVVAPTYSLTDRIFTLACEHVERCFPHHIADLSLREHAIKVYNIGGGISVARAKSADNPTSLLGDSLDWLVVDEAAKLPDKVWERHLSARLVDKCGWSLCVSTPMGTNWFYREFRRAREDPMYASWALPSSANPHLDRSMIEMQRASLPAEVFRQEFEAEFLGAEPDPCTLCGWRDPEAHNMVTLLPDEEPLVCTACGTFVDEHGHTLVPPSDGARFIIGEIGPDEVDAIAAEVERRKQKAACRS